jgi:hypothetical protein
MTIADRGHIFTQFLKQNKEKRQNGVVANCRGVDAKLQTDGMSLRFDWRPQAKRD